MDASALKAVRSGNICGSPREGQYLSADISGRRIAFASHRGTSHAHLKKAMHALSHNVAAYMKLITHVLPLREAAAAIQGLSESTSHAVHGKDCIKLVIDMSSSALGSPERMSRHA
jgi:threonine dehydrogenase-like Zn-dependent dehydrogenase